MKTNKISKFLLLAVLVAGMAIGSSAAGVSYLPGVTKEMSSSSYWTDNDDVLMTWDEISELNKKTVSKTGTYMYDLENMSPTVNGVALNEALIKSTTADVKYYLGWTYIESREKATQEDYDELIANTQNPNAEEEQPVKYGVAVKRTVLRTFPTEKAVWDSPQDPETDYQCLASVRVNEPLVITSVSNDGKFYLAKSICCSGWVSVQDVAVCKDKDEWLDAWKIQPEDALVVYGDRVYTEMSVTGKETSEVMLTMGTVLELAEVEDPNALVDNRAAYQNYVAYVPYRKDDGSYAKKLTLISENRKVSMGYLPLTESNLVAVAFEALGNTYGWGGGLNSEDCSSYIRNVYKCFGIELARNTIWQSEMPMARVTMTNLCREERIKILDEMPAGTILFFSGHEMLYLGKDNGEYYVVSSLGTVMQPENPAVVQRVSSITINNLSVKRKNGKDWLNNLTCAIVPFRSEENTGFPKHSWYNDSVTFCIKSGLMNGDEGGFFHPDDNVTWAELLQIVYNMSGEETHLTQSQDGKWYDVAVNWARNNNLVLENDADFSPEADISRQQLASVLYLYAKYKGIDVSVGEDTNILSYDDIFEVSEYAIPSMQFAVGAGIVNGKTKNTLNPKDSTSRAEVATMIERFVKYNNEEIDS